VGIELVSLITIVREIRATWTLTGSIIVTQNESSNINLAKAFLLISNPHKKIPT
jgi:hypothetical protein